MVTFHTVGDSHATKRYSLWNFTIDDMPIVDHYLPGKLMYTFGKGKLSVANIKTMGVQDNDYVCFCFGEIDCRNHVHKHVTSTRSYQQIVDELVKDYFEAIIQNVSQYRDLSVLVFNIPPPARAFQIHGDFPFLGTDEQRQLYYTYCNDKIKTMCAANNYTFIDVYKQYCDEDGFLNKQYSDGMMHLKNGLFVESFLNNHFAQNRTEI